MSLKIGCSIEARCSEEKVTLSPRKECLNTSGNGGDVGKGVLTFVLTLPFLVSSILSKCFFAS